MKQLTSAQARKLALSDAGKLQRETLWAMGDWVREYAARIAEIEAGALEKTYCGEWPKGWRHAMKESAKWTAESKLIADYSARHCRVIDGAVWLNDFQEIKRLETL